MELVKKFFKDESGASMVEYGLLVALIAVMLIASLTALKDSLVNIFGAASGELNTAASAS